MEEQIIQWAERIVILLVTAIVAWERAKRWFYGRNNKNRRRSTNPNMIPGKSETCIKHGEKLVKIETELIRIMEDIKELGKKLDKRRK